MTSLRNRYLLLSDAVLLSAAPFLLFALRFEGLHWPQGQSQSATLFVLVSVPLWLVVLLAFGMYRTLWRYASIAELEQIAKAWLAGWIATWIMGAGLLPGLGLTSSRVPYSVLFANGLLALGLIAAPRLLIRMGGWHALRKQTATREDCALIAGAGTAGLMILKELKSNSRLTLRPVGFVDDDPRKQGLRVGGLPILGRLADTAEVIRHYHVRHVLIAMPTAPGTVVRHLVQTALDAGIKARTVPSLGEILTGDVSVTALREVEIDDLLRREPVKTDFANVARLADERTVLVTGGGGSIGSELCRQLANFSPSKLVILGHGENPIFEILHELRRKHPELNAVPVIADIRDQHRIRGIFAEHRPFAVFHAAAHKHVPLMEANVVEAITNNVLGTRNIVDAAVEFGTSHFVFISTDKAVRPTNVMGASKRVAEHIVRRAARRNQRNFVAVRFGNVLGSRGSVVPTFVRQIQEGGPVTVTHPEMRRFFMTIPEAVQLVLQAAALGKGSELFMLDMGEPVKVVDLARDLIRLSGLTEGEDIEIKFTGIRPGEKLYEEMFFSDEVAERTEHPKVLRARNGHVESWGDHLIDQLIETARNGDTEDNLRAMLQVIVPDFAPDQKPPTTLTPTPSFGMPAIPDQPARVAGHRRSGETAS